MSFLKDCFELTKPRLTLLVLATAFLGYFMAPGAPFEIRVAVHLLVASACLGGGINALNQYFERHIDAKMKRTENRPIPAGRMEAAHALGFGSALTLGGIGYLWMATNPLTSFLGALTALTYVLAYTPLKLVTPLNTLVGAISGALPCIMGWAARQNYLPAAAWSLFLILFFWQLPHFCAIAWVYKEDYDKSGLKMMTHGDPDGKSTGQKIILSSLLLFPVTLLPVWAGLGQKIYFFSAVLAGAIFISAAIRLYFQKLAHAKKFVTLSIYYLLALILAMIADKIL